MAKSSNLNVVFNIGDIREVILIGCGGTGAILAEHLCRMIAGYKLKCELVIYDGDTVEQNNIKRQNFYPYEIGQNKAEAIALRLAGKYGLKIS
ncbi:MAG: ThiF family adenylyltransferase, partial [Phycisphaerae bacterium]